MLLLTRSAVFCTRFLHTCCQKNHVLQTIRPKLMNIFCRTKTITTRKPQRFRPMHATDKVSKDYSIIYVNNMGNSIFYAHLAIYSLSLPTMIWSAYLIATNYQDIPFNLSMTHPAMGGILYFLFSGVLMVILSAICRKSIYRLYHNPDTDHYIGIVQNWYLVKSQLSFTADQARYRQPSLAKGFLGNLEINKRPFFVVGTDFKQPAYYNRLMGWDLGTPLEEAKDVDLKELIRKAKKKVKQA